MEIDIARGRLCVAFPRPHARYGTGYYRKPKRGFEFNRNQNGFQMPGRGDMGLVAWRKGK